jgi:hypothetical protein
MSGIERELLDSAASCDVGDLFGGKAMEAAGGTYTQGKSSTRRLAADKFVSSMVPTSGDVSFDKGRQDDGKGLSVSDYIPGLGGAAAKLVGGAMDAMDKMLDDELQA